MTVSHHRRTRLEHGLRAGASLAPTAAGAAVLYRRTVSARVAAVSLAEEARNEILVHSAPGAADHVLILVEDDGPGIASEMIERLFDPFKPLGAPAMPRAAA